MPYPTEHSARIKAPGSFQEDSFRSKNIADGVRIIIGRLKGETTTTAQAYRFDKEKFTAAEAKKWLKDNDVTYSGFEAASESKTEEFNALLAKATEMYNEAKDWKPEDHRNGDQNELVQDIHDLAGELGAKHKDGSRKAVDCSAAQKVLMQTYHDHAASLGADCEIAVKVEESLDDKMTKIRNAFYDNFSKPTPSATLWCREVFEDSIIADAGEDGMFRIGYSASDDGIEFDPREKWEKVEQEYVPAKSEEVLVSFGGEIKAKDNGHYGEYLIRFSDEKNADVTKDFFDKQTDYGFAGSIKSPVYLHHCLPVKTGDGVRRITQAIGEATLSLTDDGVAIDAELYDWLVKSHDAFVARIAKTVKTAIKAGKMGWSSGTASHLVQRTKIGESYHVDKWPLGLDATITYAPAGIKQGVGVVEIKSINPAEFDEPETGAETAASGVPVADQARESQEKPQESFKMEPKDIQAITDAVKASIAAEEAAKTAAAEKAKADKDAMKALLLEVIKEQKGGKVTNAGGFKISGPGAGAKHDKTEFGDDAHKAFNFWLKTGDREVLRDLDAARENPDMLDPERVKESLKTAYPLVGDVQYEGLELVPLEVVKDIRELRDKVSVARLAGASVLPVGAVTNYVPVEKARTGKFVIQSGGQGNAFDANTVQLIDRATLTVYDFTRTIPISRQLLADAVTNLEAWWNRHVARAEAATENYYFVSVGTGSSQPQAALVGSALGVTAASTTAITAAELVNVYHAVPQQYRNKLATVCLGTTAGYIRGLAAAYGFSFIPTPAGSLQGGNINGDEWIIAPTNRLFEEDNMPAQTAGLKTLFIGNFEEYLIGDREALSVFRDPFSQAVNGNVCFHCFFRRGGTTWTNEAFKHLIMHA